MEANHKIVTFEKFDAITFQSDDLDLLAEVLRNYLSNPKHLVINFDLFSSPSDETMDYLNFLSTILKSENYSVQIFSPSPEMDNQLESHRCRNLPVIDDLSFYISRLDVIEKELRIKSLLKSYVDETMKQIFSKSGIIIKRGELAIEDGGNSFKNNMNYFQTFQLEDAFFSFVIGSTEEFFESFINTLGETALSPIFSEIVSRIPSELLEDIKIHDYLTHPYDSFPTEKVEIQNKEYHHFKNCSVMVIPLECDLGDFRLEVWIPKQFAQVVFKFLNPGS